MAKHYLMRNGFSNIKVKLKTKYIGRFISHLPYCTTMVLTNNLQQERILNKRLKSFSEIVNMLNNDNKGERYIFFFYLS